MSNLVLELYSEEIPASMQQPAAAQLQKRVEDFLRGFDVEAESVKAYATPQRLALLVYGLPKQLPTRVEEKKGPRIDAPQQAIDGFLRTNGLASVDELQTQDKGKGAFYVLEIKQEGQSMADALAAFLPQMIRDFDWRKSMRWGEGSLRWVRPLHNILCCFDGKIVPFKIAGITAGDSTTGHRFMHNRRVKITTPDDYLPNLRDAKVIADQQERADIIFDYIKNLQASKKLRIDNNEENLLREIIGLVEFPVPLLGRFDDRFMKLPAEVLASVMRTHQKYIPLSAGNGELVSEFIIVSNIETKDGGKEIIAGNERVLSARFADAEFFWGQDKKISLEARREKLKNVVFHAKIGSVYEKTERIEKIARLVSFKEESSLSTFAAKATVLDFSPDTWEMLDYGNKDGLRQVAQLCKSDLTSEMVFEFPELQGIMGGYYALDAGLGNDVAAGIHNHYKPIGENDEIPNNPEALIVAMADKLDSLIEFWRAGEKPTSSKDPYALRRAALGVIRIIVKREFDVSLPVLMDMIRRYEEPDLPDFILERLKVYLRNKENVPHDVVEAVLASKVDHYNIFRIHERAIALKNFIDSKDGKNIRIAYIRAFGICKAEKRLPKKGADILIDEKLFKESEEAELFDALTQYKTIGFSLKELAALRAPVDAFFEKVLVNDEDPAIRNNRFSLLQKMIATMRQVAAFELIEQRD